jgi:hypothetical protein
MSRQIKLVLEKRRHTDPTKRDRWFQAAGLVASVEKSSLFMTRGACPRAGQEEHRQGELTVSWLHQFRRLRSHWEKLPSMHQAMLTLGCAMICFRTLQMEFCKRFLHFWHMINILDRLLRRYPARRMRLTLNTEIQSRRSTSLWHPS